jgi:hypothetical protein
MIIGNGFDPTPARTAASRRRGGTVNTTTLFRVDNEVVTLAVLAERLGCTQADARNRVKLARKRVAGLTWATLAAIDAPDSTP